ncbi:hypothetical protein Tco_0104390 [Tanacetum coccineum]
MQDKNIAISELKKLIENCKGKSVETQFNKPSVVRQPNAQRIPKTIVLENLLPFSNSLLNEKFFKRNSRLIKLMCRMNCPKHVSHQSPREKVGSNDMVHNYYLEKAKKSAQLQKDKDVNGKPSMIDPARLPNTANGCKPKPRNWQASMMPEWLSQKMKIFTTMMSDHQISDLSTHNDNVSTENNTSGPFRPRTTTTMMFRHNRRPRTTTTKMSVEKCHFKASFLKDKSRQIMTTSDPVGPKYKKCSNSRKANSLQQGFRILFSPLLEGILQSNTRSLAAEENNNDQVTLSSTTTPKHSQEADHADAFDTPERQLWRDIVPGDKLVSLDVQRNKTAQPYLQQRQSPVALTASSAHVVGG